MTQQPVTTGSMMLLPPSKDVCAICATAHRPEMPHNAESLYYQSRFHLVHGRIGTWADAVAHCTPEMRTTWRELMEEQGFTFTEPKGDEPIAEPPHDAIHMMHVQELQSEDSTERRE